MGDRNPKRLRGLPGERAAAGVGDRPGDHHRKPLALFFKERLCREDRRLAIERIKDRFDKKDVRAAVHKAADLIAIGLHQLIKGDRPQAGVVDIG